MDESTQQIKEYLNKLPKPLQDAILSNEWRKRLGEIGQKYSLHLDQISSLEYEVLFVMIGMEPQNDLVENIQRELAVSKILAEQLAGDIDARIFKYILKVMEEKTDGREERFAESKLEGEKDTKYDEPSTMNEGAGNKISEVRSEIIENETGKIVEVKKDDLAPVFKVDAEKVEDKPHQKMTEPPMNLPTGDEGGGNMENEIRNKKYDGEVENVKMPPNTQDHDFELEKHTYSPINTPIQMVNTHEPQSLAETKLSGIVKSENIQVVKGVMPEPVNPVSYAKNDPYREPLE
jgi:hypothetical protein